LSFLIAKEIDGNGLEELASRPCPNDAVSEAVTRSQKEEHEGSVIVVLDSESGACARMRAEKLAPGVKKNLETAVLSKLKKEIARIS